MQSATQPCEHYPDIFTLQEGKPQAEQERLRMQNERVDPFYRALRHLLRERFKLNGDVPVSPRDFPGDLSDSDKAYFSAVYGMLLADQLISPTMGRDLKTAGMGPEDIFLKDPEGKEIYIANRYLRHVVGAVDEYHASANMAQAVWRVLRKIGTSPASTDATIFTRQLAEVTRRLVEQQVNPADAQIELLVTNALAVVLRSEPDGRAAAMDIDLPDLEEGATAEIVADNVRALAALYFAAMLEEGKVFAVADKVAEQFFANQLPLSRGPGGEAIYEYLKKVPQRFTESERRGFYSRAFGLAQGPVEDSLVNAEFLGLWTRFLSSMSLYLRQSAAERMLVTPEQLFKSAKDLAVNLSLHGYGIAHFAAVELQALIKEVKAMLSYPDVLAAYGVTDVWGLVERVSNLELGGAVNGVRQRTMATAGSRIMLYLADQAPILSMPAGTLTLEVVNGGGKLVKIEVFQHIERWLAVTGTPESAVEKGAEPVSLNTQYTLPNIFAPRLPGVFKEALRGASLPGGSGKLPQA